MCQVPQYWFLCLSDIFALSTGLELIYSETPSAVKSMMIAFYTLVYALGHISIVIVDVTLPETSRESPIIVYGIITALMTGFATVFAVALRGFTYRYDLTLPFQADHWPTPTDNENSFELKMSGNIQMEKAEDFETETETDIDNM